MTPDQAPCTQMVKSRDFGIGKSGVQFFACARHLTTRIAAHSTREYEKEGRERERERERAREREREGEREREQ